MEIERRQRAFHAVDRSTELPMLILSVVMVPLILAPLLLDLSAGLEDAFLVADWAIWAVFALELGVKTYLAPERAAYLRGHWFDVLIPSFARSGSFGRLERCASFGSFAWRPSRRGPCIRRGPSWRSRGFSTSF